MIKITHRNHKKIKVKAHTRRHPKNKKTIIHVQSYKRRKGYKNYSKNLKILSQRNISKKQLIKNKVPKKMKKDVKENVIALRMGENIPGHRSMDSVIEVLSWNLGGIIRGKRQEWWDEMIAKFPEIKKYVGKTRETDRPEYAPEGLLREIGEFIVEKEDIYEKVDYGYYKSFPNKEKTTLLVMKGLNVNAGPESTDLVYDSNKGAILKGDIIGMNTWGDGEIMVNHEVLYEFDPEKPEEILEGFYRFGEDVFQGFWTERDLEQAYRDKYFNIYLDEWNGESLESLEERLENKYSKNKKRLK